MSYREGESGINPDEILSGFEVMQLRDGLLWPVADRIWGDDFVQTASPGEVEQRSRTILTPHGLRRGAVEVSCYLNDSEAGPGEDVEAVHQISVRYEVPQLSLTDSLIQAALLDFKEEYREGFEEEYGDVVQAWQVHQYDFHTMTDFGLVETDHSYELQDPNANVVWDDRPEHEDDGEGESESEEKSVIVEVDMLELLAEKMKLHMTVGDRANVLAALSILGLVKDVRIEDNAIVWE